MKFEGSQSAKPETGLSRLERHNNDETVINKCKKDLNFGKMKSKGETT